MAPGIENVKINVKQWTLRDGIWMSYKPSSSQGETVGALSVGGAWYLGNDHSGFFVLWGIHGNSADGDVVTWAETWGSFLQGNISEASPRGLQWHDFGTALQEYIRNHTGALSTHISDPGFKVKVKVKRTEFLERKTHRVIIDIDGWEDRPLSIVNCLHLVAHGWT